MRGGERSCELREILLKICGLCAEAMQILGDTVLMVLCEATLSEGHYTVLLVLCEATLSEGHYLTTVVAHFLVPGLTYKTVTCNEQHFCCI
jgi:hypothetical protein